MAGPPSVVRRAHDVQRPARLEEAAVMVDAMDLVRIGEDAGVAVHDDGVLVPARPQLAADVHELMRSIVALVGRLHLLAVIGRLVVVQRGDDVPRRAAARQVIERRPQPRGMERMLMAHRVGGAEPDMRGRGGHERQQREGIVLGRLGGVADRRRQRAGKGVGDVVEVGEEDHVELAALADPGDVLVELGLGPVVAGRRGARMPPHGDAVIGRTVHQELRQVHHGLGHYRRPERCHPREVAHALTEAMGL